MRDGARFAGQGVPAVVLVTEKFWAQGDAVATFVGLPDLPRVRVPHPIAGLPREEMDAIATRIVADLLTLLRG